MVSWKYVLFEVVQAVTNQSGILGSFFLIAKNLDMKSLELYSDRVCFSISIVVRSRALARANDTTGVVSSGSRARTQVFFAHKRSTHGICPA